MPGFTGPVPPPLLIRRNFFLILLYTYYRILSICKNKSRQNQNFFSLLIFLNCQSKFRYTIKPLPQIVTPGKWFSDICPNSVYSARSAATGSFFAAFLDGIRPPISVRMTLRIISRIALPTGRTALIPVEPVRAWITALPGINRSKVIPIPINPEQSPTIKVSALNT